MPIRIIVVDRIGSYISITMEREWIVWIASEAVLCQPHARVGIVLAREEVVEASVLVPLLPGEGIVVVWVGEVAVGQLDLAVGLVAVVVAALPVLLRQPS